MRVCWTPRSKALKVGHCLKTPDAVLELLDALEIGKFSLMAHSCGCLFAAALAVRAPQRLKGHLVLMSPWNLSSCPETPWTTKVTIY